MAADEGQRKLAAILAADVVGYSRLMADDERATVATLKEARGVFKDRIEAHGGRLIDTAGDSVLAEFRSVVEAVQCAVEVQAQLTNDIEAIPKHRRMFFRIGVNLGDVIEEADGTIYGDGVNIAARLEGLAEPGRVLISEDAHRQVEGKLECGFTDAGEHEVKNIAKSVRAWRVATDGSRAPPPGTRAAALAIRLRRPRIIAGLAAVVAVITGLAVWGVTIQVSVPQMVVADGTPTNDPVHVMPQGPSIAVLPFENLGGDTEYDYLADGMTENIIATLSQARGLAVIARTSSNTFKGRVVTAREAAAELGVRYILEGSVQTEGDQLRITAQLIDAANDLHLMTERYDRPLADIFSLQDEISLNVASELQVTLTEGPHAKLWRGGTDNHEAWSLHQQGLVAQRKYTPEDNRIARGMFREAVTLDPDFALAWVYLGWTHNLAARLGFEDDPDENYRLASEQAANALAIDPELPDAMVLEAMQSWLWRRDFALAMRQAGAAAEAAPNHSVVLAIAAHPFGAGGEPKVAIDLMQRAEKLSPYPPAWYASLMSLYYILDQQFDEALSAADIAIRRGDKLAGVFPIYAFAGLGKYERARASLEAYYEIDPAFSVQTLMQWADRDFPLREEDMNFMAGLLRAAGVPETPPGKEVSPPLIAVLPFENISRDSEQEYFADGLTEEIIAALTRFDGLRVVARGSTFNFKGRTIDVRTVGNELGAEYVVEGSVRKASNTVRVTVQLLDAESGAQLWAETYERQLTAANLFAVQDEITGRIVGNVADSHGAIFRARSRQRDAFRTDNIDVYECLLRHNEFRRNFSPETHLVARTCLEKAVELDPDYGEAWARLANVYAMEYAFKYNTRPELYDALSRNREAAERAAQLDPTNEWARLALARSHYFRADAAQVFREAERVVELNPNNADTLASAGWYLARAGHWDRGLEMVEQAMALNPNFPNWYHSTFFENHYRNGEYEAALAKAHDMNTPGWHWSYLYFAIAYAQLGDYENAKASVDELLAVYPTFAEDGQDFFARWYFIDHHVEHIVEGLSKAGLDIPERVAN